jgi:hypothetical protein
MEFRRVLFRSGAFAQPKGVWSGTDKHREVPKAEDAHSSAPAQAGRSRQTQCEARKALNRPKRFEPGKRE